MPDLSPNKPDFLIFQITVKDQISTWHKFWFWSSSVSWQKSSLPSGAQRNSAAHLQLPSRWNQSTHWVLCSSRDGLINPEFPPAGWSSTLWFRVKAGSQWPRRTWPVWTLASFWMTSSSTSTSSQTTFVCFYLFVCLLSVCCNTPPPTGISSWRVLTVRWLRGVTCSAASSSNSWAEGGWLVRATSPPSRKNAAASRSVWPQPDDEGVNSSSSYCVVATVTWGIRGWRRGRVTWTFSPKTSCLCLSIKSKMISLFHDEAEAESSSPYSQTNRVLHFLRAHWFLVVVCFAGLEEVRMEEFQPRTGEQLTWSGLVSRGQRSVEL